MCSLVSYFLTPKCREQTSLSGEQRHIALSDTQPTKIRLDLKSTDVTRTSRGTKVVTL